MATAPLVWSQKMADSTMHAKYTLTQQTRYAEHTDYGTYGAKAHYVTQREQRRYDMTHHMVHCILLGHVDKEPMLGDDNRPIGNVGTINKKDTVHQALAQPMVMSQTPYSILDLGCGSGIWACDMAL